MGTIGTLAAVALLAAGCGSDDNNTASDTDSTTAPTTAPPDPSTLEVDRSGRFASLETFCTPPDGPPEEAPTATDDGIAADTVSITHIRVTLEDLEGLGFAIPIGDPADQAERFVGIVNDRCGGINGRKLDLSLVEAAPLAQGDPAAEAEAACIEATEDNNAVFAFSGSGWGGQGGAACVTGGEHNTIYITTYNVSQEDLAGSENRLYSTTVSSADGLEYLARTLDADGLLEGKTIGVVFQDSPGDPEIVEQGLLDTLDELGYEVTRADPLGCAGGNSCSTGVIESVRGMVADGVNVIFPLLNVINLPAYIGEMVTQGVKPGDVQFYQSGYHAQSGDLVSSKVVDFSGPEAGALYNGTMMVAPGATGSFRLPDFEAGEFSEMCNREYQEAGGPKYTATDPETNSAYGAVVGMCNFIRLISRALDAAGPNPTRADLASAVENLGAIDLGGGVVGSFGPGKYFAPNFLNRMRFHYPCEPDKIPFGPNMCILPEGESFPIPQG
jgi:hypothetical protein